jgi:hypothetical protein
MPKPMVASTYALAGRNASLFENPCDVINISFMVSGMSPSPAARGDRRAIANGVA